MVNKVGGGILLVAGTAIGAGMLALPVAMGAAGFLPSVALFFAFWLVMTYTALLFLEVNCWTGSGTNLITMARSTLGVSGAVVSWVAYLFLLYALLTAYIAGCGTIFGDLFNAPPPEWKYSIPLVLLFAVLLCFGVRPFDYVNRMLMFGLVVTYALMFFLLLPHVSVVKLERAAWGYTLTSAAVVATSFGFHIVIPTLYRYFDGDLFLLRRALLIGSTIPLLVYLLWQALALGIIPLDGPEGLLAGYMSGTNGVHLLIPAIGSPRLALIAQVFSLCAIITSFIGVALSLNDFLADGLKLKRTPMGQLLLVLLTLGPPFLIAVIDPRAFLSALEYAGVFGVVFLLILLPAVMVWSGRYLQHRSGGYRAPGGKAALVATMAFALGIIALELLKL